MRIAVFGLIVSLLAVACTGSPTPSIDLRDLKAVVEADDHILVGFSTDQLSRSEAQEVMLLAAALVARERGGDLFQFRSVSAKDSSMNRPEKSDTSTFVRLWTRCNRAKLATKCARLIVPKV